MANKQRGAGQGEAVKGLDLAVKNTELKEEIRLLKEKQNLLLRESLQHQYMRYRVQIEADRILQKQKAELQHLEVLTEAAILAVKNASLPTPDAGSQPFKENPSVKSQARKPIKRQSRINFI